MIILIRFLHPHWINTYHNVNKTLRKGIMLRSELENQANKDKDTRDIKLYEQQRNVKVQ